MLVAFCATYVIGFLISLLLLHAFKRELGVDHYDPPHPEYYDDYSSNAHAYLAFSFMWPIFWGFMSMSLIYSGLIGLSKWIGNFFPKDSIKSKKKKKKCKS